MAEFNSYLLGKARKSVGNLTIVYAKRQKYRTGESVRPERQSYTGSIGAADESKASRQVRPAYPACHPQRLCGE